MRQRLLLRRPPHTRGDEPTAYQDRWEVITVRPTRVGMNRSARIRARVAGSPPHTRGDEPDDRIVNTLAPVVRPTHVEMNQSCKDPWPISPASTITGAAPHPWGRSSPAMYLSRLTFDLASAAARRDLSDAYETHRTLTRAVSDGPDAEPGRFLWRQERSESGEAPIVLMQSEVEPQFARLPEGYLLDAATKEWEPVVAEGLLLTFLVRANPSVKKDGKRHPLRRLEEQLAWMQRQAAVHLGLELVQCGVTGSGEIRSRRRAGAQIVATAVQFEGVARAADPERLATGIRTGIGHSRLLGLGMVSIARLA